MKYQVFLVSLELRQLGLAMWISPQKMVIRANSFTTCGFGEGNGVEDELHIIKRATYCLSKGSKISGRSIWLNSRIQTQCMSNSKMKKRTFVPEVGRMQHKAENWTEVYSDRFRFRGHHMKETDSY